MGRYWLVLDGNGSVEGADLRVVLNGIWWDLVSMELSHAIWKRKINSINFKNLDTWNISESVWLQYM